MCPWQTNSSVCASEPACVLVLIDVSRLLGERTAGRVRRATTNDRKQMTHFESREWCCQVHAGVAQSLVWLKPSDNPEIVREFETRLLLVVFSVFCLFLFILNSIYIFFSTWELVPFFFLFLPTRPWRLCPLLVCLFIKQFTRLLLMVLFLIHPRTPKWKPTAAVLCSRDT